MDKPCWKYFSCCKEFRDRCPIYQNRKKNNTDYDCWFEADIDIMKGGPAGRGPCYDCDIMKAQYPELQSFFEK